MLILGRKDDYYHDNDEWTLRSANGRRAAHSEQQWPSPPMGR